MPKHANPLRRAVTDVRTWFAMLLRAMLPSRPRPLAAAMPFAARGGLVRLLGTYQPVPQSLRRPHQQKNRRRDDALVPRMEATVPQTPSPFVQAWLSSWDEPRAGIAKLRSDVWAMPLRTDIVHRCVTWQRACMRQGTSKTKHRHEVRGGGRKPRPQKKTGRSRQGSIRSPLWVGGGHAHPKRPRDFSYKLNRKVVSLGFRMALSDKYRRNALIVLRDLELESDSTEELESRLANLGIGLEKHRGPRPRAHEPAAAPCPKDAHAIVCKFRASA